MPVSGRIERRDNLRSKIAAKKGKVENTHQHGDEIIPGLKMFALLKERKASEFNQQSKHIGFFPDSYVVLEDILNKTETTDNKNEDNEKREVRSRQRKSTKDSDNEESKTPKSQKHLKKVISSLKGLSNADEVNDNGLTVSEIQTKDCSVEMKASDKLLIDRSPKKGKSLSNSLNERDLSQDDEIKVRKNVRRGRPSKKEIHLPFVIEENVSEGKSTDIELVKTQRERKSIKGKSKIDHSKGEGDDTIILVNKEKMEIDPIVEVIEDKVEEMDVDSDSLNKLSRKGRKRKVSENNESSLMTTIGMKAMDIDSHEITSEKYSLNVPSLRVRKPKVVVVPSQNSNQVEEVIDASQPATISLRPRKKSKVESESNSEEHKIVSLLNVSDVNEENKRKSTKITEISEVVESVKDKETVPGLYMLNEVRRRNSEKITGHKTSKSEIVPSKSPQKSTVALLKESNSDKQSYAEKYKPGVVDVDEVSKGSETKVPGMEYFLAGKKRRSELAKETSTKSKDFIEKLDDTTVKAEINVNEVRRRNSEKITGHKTSKSEIVPSKSPRKSSVALLKESISDKQSYAEKYKPEVVDVDEVSKGSETKVPGMEFFLADKKRRSDLSKETPTKCKNFLEKLDDTTVKAEINVNDRLQTRRSQAAAAGEVTPVTSTYKRTPIKRSRMSDVSNKGEDIIPGLLTIDDIKLKRTAEVKLSVNGTPSKRSRIGDVHQNTPTKIPGLSTITEIKEQKKVQEEVEVPVSILDSSVHNAPVTSSILKNRASLSQNSDLFQTPSSSLILNSSRLVGINKTLHSSISTDDVLIDQSSRRQNVTFNAQVQVKEFGGNSFNSDTSDACGDCRDHSNIIDDAALRLSRDIDRIRAKINEKKRIDTSLLGGAAQSSVGGKSIVKRASGLSDLIKTKVDVSQSSSISHSQGGHSGNVEALPSRTGALKNVNARTKPQESVVGSRKSYQIPSTTYGVTVADNSIDSQISDDEDTKEENAKESGSLCLLM